MSQKVHDSSLDIKNENLQKLKAIFPNFVREDTIDFDALKEFFASENMLSDDGTYGLAWNGKKQAYKNIAIPATGTLMYDETESKDADTTKNIFIEGDNLEVLKLLQKKYMKSIKMIYIDPPYNTGKDFVYSDNFRENISDYYEKTGQTQGGVKMTTNTDTNGRYHSDWLTMMYPRLFLARNLLQDDGVIFVSISDYEVKNLKMILDEIFGEENFLEQIIWKNGRTSASYFTKEHEYILVYTKNKEKLKFFTFEGEETISDRTIKKPGIKNPLSKIYFPAGIDFDSEDKVFPKTFGGSENINIIEGVFECKNKKLANDVVIEAGWTMKDMILGWINGDEVIDQKGQKVTKFFFKSNGVLQYEKEKGTIHPKSVINGITTKNGTNQIEELFGIAGIFDFPKPSKLIQDFISFITQKDGDIILDFFAGSGTTAHAVMELNAQDGGERRCISVQLPELTDEKSEAYKAGYTKISQITRERIRRAGEKIKVDYTEKLRERETPLDVGFKAFTLQNSNYRKWKNLDETNSTEDILTQSKLLLEKPLVDDATELGVVYEVLLKEGFELLARVEYDAKLGVYRVRDELKSMTICFAKSLTLEFITSLGLAENEIFVCYDSALDDALKVNLVKHYEVRVV